MVIRGERRKREERGLFVCVYMVVLNLFDNIGCMLL